MPDWTLAEAASWLDPEISEKHLLQLVRMLGISPVPQTNRPHGSRGQPVKRYDVAEIISLHAALYPWLNRKDPASSVTDAINVTYYSG